MAFFISATFILVKILMSIRREVLPPWYRDLLP